MSKTSWWAVPYIDYLNAVDNVLEIRTGLTSTQEELAEIAIAHENNNVPAETAEMIIAERNNSAG